MLLSLTLLLQLLPTHQLEGGCLLGDTVLQEQIALSYLQQFPVKTSPSVQGVHLSLKGTDKMKVVWLNPTPWTRSSNYKPVCSYGISATSLNTNATGTAYSYPDGHFRWTLNAVVLNLKGLHNPSRVYFYRCGDPKFGWSQVFNFTHQPQDAMSDDSRLYWKSRKEKQLSTSIPKIAIVGDLGVIHGDHTIASITKHVQNGDVQLLLHAGDISYADKFGGKSQNNSEVWVEYMNKLQQIVSRVPYMVAPGNHDVQFNFAAYLNWLKMPSSESSSGSPFWFSFDYMGVHFTSISTEHDFSRNSTQYRWIERDLKRANQNRDEVPWIMVYGHRPLYCTSLACMERCLVEAPRFRAELEDLLYYQKVDVYMCGHDHQYERSFPVYKQVVDRRDYVNPLAPVYIVNGGAGNPEFNDPTFMPFIKWRAFYKSTFDKGYLLLQPTRWQLKFQYILSKQNKVVDTFTMSRTPN